MKSVVPGAAEQQARERLGEARRIVVKVGSGVLTNSQHGLAHERMSTWCGAINDLIVADKEVVLVSSGAVAEGCFRLGLTERPTSLPELQAAAAVGQMGLVEAYEQAFRRHGRRTAMVLLTHEDLADRQRYLNAGSTLSSLLALGVVPVVNENDTVATEEIRFGDNDTLAALVTNLVGADLLLILTDADGLHRADPRAQPNAPIVTFASASDVALSPMAGDTGGKFGRGGMVTKLAAARLAARSGANTIIAPGRVADVVSRILSGAGIGTLLVAEEAPLVARKRWIADQRKHKGELVLDTGAVQALTDKSLLAVGIVGVKGSFSRGDLVHCVDETGQLIAQGLVNYASADVLKLLGAASGDIEQRLGFALEPEVIHRNNLALMGAERGRS